jgi:3-hydroxyisobutyrate dehydrogenase-like beta-hydroxyacid dehydrogenase
MKSIETVGILGLGKMGCPIAQAERSGMPWAEKDMSIVLEEADRARLSLPLAGAVKETIKGLKIRMGLGMPEIPERL